MIRVGTSEDARDSTPKGRDSTLSRHPLDGPVLSACINPNTTPSHNSCSAEDTSLLTKGHRPAAHL
jgi:hypothetical protein